MAEEKAEERKDDAEEYLKEGKEEYLSWREKQITEHPVVKVHHGKWKELMAWTLLGKQFMEWGIDGKEALQKVPLKRRKKQVVVNLMKPLGEAIEGKMNLFYQLVGYPNSSEQNDLEASKVATKFLAHNDYVNNVEELMDQMKFYLTYTGNTFITWQWDRDKFGFIPKDEGNGNSKPVKQEGEVVGRVPSVFNVRPDPTAKTREQMRWVMEIFEVPLDELKEKFPKAFSEEVEMERGESGDKGQKYQGMNEPEEEKDKDEETRIVAVHWERPTGKYKKGRLIISIEDRLLRKPGANPAPDHDLPFWHVGFKPSGNSLWCTGPMHHVQDIQREINRQVSITSEHIEGWRPKMVIPRESVLKEGAFTTENFELLEMDLSKGQPFPLNTPRVPPEVGIHLSNMLGFIDKVSNVHEVSYSQLPKYASRAPASLFSMMLEQENLKIDPVLKRINRYIKESGSFRLKLMEKHYKEERMVKIVGEGNKASTEYFKGADIEGNYDVLLEIGASIHQSSVVQQHIVERLFEIGVLTERDRNKILKLVYKGDVSEELRGDIADEQRALRENEAFRKDTYMKERKKGGVFVYLHDDHETHLDYHTNLIKSEEAQGWEEEKFEALNAHIMEHWAVYIQTQQLQQQAGGAPGVPGGLSQPEVGGGGTPGPVPEEGEQSVAPGGETVL